MVVRSRSRSSNRGVISLSANTNRPADSPHSAFAAKRAVTVLGTGCGALKMTESGAGLPIF